MATLTSSVIDSTPNFVDGNFGAKDVRLAVVGNALPGLFARGDFAVSQRAAGANMSADISQGCAFLDPAQATHQGLYLVRRTSGTAWNTNVDGGITWTAADATNPRIDLVLLEVKDNAEDASGTTGFRIRIETGTPNALATHQLATTYWPTIPSGCVPIAAIRVPATATTLTTANISNLNPVGGPGRVSYNTIATAEATASTAFTRLATPDVLCAYVPHAAARVRLGFKAQWKISVASGTQGVALFVDDAQARYPVNTGSPQTAEYNVTSLGTLYSHLSTINNTVSGTSGMFQSFAGSGADVGDGASPLLMAGNTGTATQVNGGLLELYNFTAGWHVFELRFKTSANTLTLRNRLAWAEVIA